MTMRLEERLLHGLLEALEEEREERSPEALAQEVLLEERMLLEDLPEDGAQLPLEERARLHDVLDGIALRNRQACEERAEAAGWAAMGSSQRATGWELQGSSEEEEEAWGLGEPQEAEAWPTLLMPSWIDEAGQVSLPVASSEVVDCGEFAFPDEGGQLSCEVTLEVDGQEGGMLRVRWKADFVSPGGWWFALFFARGEKPVFDDLLGTDAQGEVVFGTQVLGFDPAKSPFLYALYAR